MNEAQLAGLRRQLGALAYDAAALTPAAAPLVAALLADLVRATDSYQELKGRAGDAGAAAQNAGYQVRWAARRPGQPASDAGQAGGRALPRWPAPRRQHPPSVHRCNTNPSQVEVLRREVGRLSAENAHLHADLLREADARAAAAAAEATRAKHLESAAAEAQCARSAALAAAAALERERDGLRATVRDLLAVGRHGGGEWDCVSAVGAAVQAAASSLGVVPSARHPLALSLA